ncbi:MAG: NAD-dependent epimerase/dehydratase family protein [Candidatus Paceibacterota bacterium]|jgi:nucleoside-diphosphate-sugar epimerase
MNDIEFIHSKVDLSPLVGSNILITGATGFFGTHLVNILSVVNCDLTTISGRDLTIKDKIQGRYDYILHFAPIPIEPILECANRGWSTVLYASSGAVYGGAQTMVRETDETFPKTTYGKEKLRSEFLLKESTLDYRICRLFTFAGTGMRDYFAITQFINAAKQGKPLTLFNHGNAIRSYMYIADAVVWILKILLDGYGIYNVGSERQTSIKQLAEAISEQFTPNSRIVNDNREFHENAPYYVPDCCKAHNLGLWQWHDLDYSVRRMME